MKMFFDFNEVKYAPHDSGIYAIYGKYNNFHYVGQTQEIDGFQGRWSTHRRDLRNNDHDNSYLQNSFNKNGENNFAFKILQIASGNCNLYTLESGWVEKLESMHFQKGWNIQAIKTTGFITYSSIATSRIKSFQIINPNGQLISGYNMNEFAKKNNLNASCLSRLIAGHNSTHKGFKSIIEKQKPKEYSLLSPERQLFIFTEKLAFCKQHDLSYGGIYKVLNGYCLQHNGWRLPILLPQFKHIINNGITEYKLLSPDFVWFYFRNLNLFVEKYKIDYQSVRNLLTNRNSYSKGWSSSMHTCFSLKDVNDVIFNFKRISDFAKTHKLIAYKLQRLLQNGKSYGGFKINTVLQQFPEIRESF